MPRKSHRVVKSLPLLCLLACFSSPGLLFATDYFIASHGDDAATGVSEQEAWRSIARVNTHSFRPGDRILFQGGQSFAGKLRLNRDSAGQPNAPVVISSFGMGRATLLAGHETGVMIDSAGCVTISNLITRGDGPDANAGYGVLCDNQLDEFRRLENLRIENVDASGFGVFGILISGKQAGFDHVRVIGCDLHDNLRGGMEIAGRLPNESPLYAHHDAVVRDCRAYHNTGDPHYDKNHSGSGMVLYQVDGGLIDNCRAWDNGGLCHHANGGVGIWSCASRAVVIQHCESFENRTHGGDGGGFDLDGGSIDCVLQYNYSHDNDGPGLMLYTYAYAEHADRGNIVRFNVSDGDSRRSRTYAGLWVRSDGGPMTGLKIYNNTVRIGRWNQHAAYVQGAGVEAEFDNNIFLSSGDALPLKVEQPQDTLRFVNNLYWRDGAPLQIQWGERAFTSLAEWRRVTGQEFSDGVARGLAEDPTFADPPSPALADTASWQKQLRLFAPPDGSILLTNGIVVKAEDRPTDIFGRALTSRSWPLGAIGAKAQGQP